MRLSKRLSRFFIPQPTQPHTHSVQTSANRCATVVLCSLLSTTTEHLISKRTHIFAREDTTDPNKPKWTLVQILVPVLVGISTIVLFITGYTVWYRWQNPSHFEFRNRVKQLFARRRRVRSGLRGDSWDIDGSLGMYYGRGSYEDRLHPNSSYWISRAAGRVKASVQGSVSTVLRSLPTVPWKQPQEIIMSQRPRSGFHVDDQDIPSPTVAKRSWWRYPLVPTSAGSTATDSSGSGSSRVSDSAPRMFSVVRGSGSSFDIVDQPADRDLSEEDQEKASLLPRSPTVRSGGSVILISRNGQNFSIRSGTTSSAPHHSPATEIPSIPELPKPSATSFGRRPLPPIPPVPILPPPTQPTSVPRDFPTVPPPVLSHQRSSSSSSDGLKRMPSLRVPDSRHTSTSTLSLHIPPPALAEPDQLTSLPSPGSPAYSGMPTPVTPPPPDRLIQWKAASEENFYQPFPSRAPSLESIVLTPQGQRT